MSNETSLNKTFFAGIWDNNPVLRLLLGMCPTLAVTAAVKPALTMGISVIFVLLFSNIVVSILAKWLKPHLRILMFTLTIATAVTIADLALKAYLPDMSAALGPYIPLIIVNCIIIGRAEACASKNPVIFVKKDILFLICIFGINAIGALLIYLVSKTENLYLVIVSYITITVISFLIIIYWITTKKGLLISVIDAIGMGLGFTITLCFLAGIREVLATGKIFEAQVMPDAFVPWAGMGMPVGAFITLGLMLGAVNIISKKTA